MARVCEICGKRTHAGRSLARRGKAKYLGGVGIKTTGVTRRQFKPNIQRVKALVDGKIRRLKVCTQCIRSGKVVKPTRKYVPKAEHEAPGRYPRPHPIGDPRYGLAAMRLGGRRVPAAQHDGGAACGPALAHAHEHGLGMPAPMEPDAGRPELAPRPARLPREPGHV